MSRRDVLIEQVIRAIPDAVHRVPATVSELEQMAAVAPLNDELGWLYEATGELAAEQFDLFEPALFVDVNGDDDALGELAGLSFFAADYGPGFYAVDTDDLVGMGEGVIFLADRGDLSADALQPCAGSLASFLRLLLDGEQPWTGPTLGQRAEQRLLARLSALPPGVEPGPPLDPMAFVTAREDHNLYVPTALAHMLEQSDGLWLGPERQIWRFDQMQRLPGIAAVAIGQDKTLGTIAVTLGGWQDLPADRLFAFSPGGAPEQGRLLGRTADVISMWIEEAGSL